MAKKNSLNNFKESRENKNMFLKKEIIDMLMTWPVEHIQGTFNELKISNIAKYILVFSFIDTMILSGILCFTSYMISIGELGFVGSLQFVLDVFLSRQCITIYVT